MKLVGRIRRREYMLKKGTDVMNWGVGRSNEFLSESRSEENKCVKRVAPIRRHRNSLNREKSVEQVRRCVVNRGRKK